MTMTKLKPSNDLVYWDANNLYAWAMSQFLPYRNFRFVDVRANM